MAVLSSLAICVTLVYNSQKLVSYVAMYVVDDITIGIRRSYTVTYTNYINIHVCVSPAIS